MHARNSSRQESSVFWQAVQTQNRLPDQSPLSAVYRRAGSANYGGCCAGRSPSGFPDQDARVGRNCLSAATYHGSADRYARAVTSSSALNYRANRGLNPSPVNLSRFCALPANEAISRAQLAELRSRHIQIQDIGWSVGPYRVARQAQAKLQKSYSKAKTQLRGSCRETHVFSFNCQINWCNVTGKLHEIKRPLYRLPSRKFRRHERSPLI